MFEISVLAVKATSFSQQLHPEYLQFLRQILHPYHSRTMLRSTVRSVAAHTSVQGNLRPTLSGISQIQHRYLSSVKTSDIDQALRDDIKNLGAILGSCVKSQDPEVFENVEKLRRLGREVCNWACYLSVL